MGGEILGYFDGPAAALRAVAEVLLIAYLAYQAFLVIRGTRAVPVLLGLTVLGLLYLVSGALGLEVVHWLLGAMAPYAAIAMIVIFQQEIRRVLRQVALKFVPARRAGDVVRYEYEDVIFAVGQLSRKAVGALIVIERDTGLRTFIQSGVALEARLSSDLLVSIFQRTAPLHDGAVIIQQGVIAAAACFLPLTTKPGLDPSLGTRHRAATGITEEADCLAIVVAETNGSISVAAAGNIELDISLDRLRERLIEHFGPVVSEPPPPAAPRVEPVAANEAVASYAESAPAQNGPEGR